MNRLEADASAQRLRLTGLSVTILGGINCLGGFAVSLAGAVGFGGTLLKTLGDVEKVINDRDSRG